MIEWKQWSEQTIRDKHGDVFEYRKLYDGEHLDLFPRAKQMLDNQEVYDPLKFDTDYDKKGSVQAPYIIANIAKLIPEIPAMFVSRSIGKIKTSLTATEEQNETTGAADDVIEGPDGDENNDKITNLPQETLDQIAKNSRLKYKHWQNIVQHQIDGALVGVPSFDDRGPLIDFKMRDLYYPHEDEMGVDLAYERTFDEVEGKFLHVYRERVEVEKKQVKTGIKRDYRLETTHMLFELDGNELTQVEEERARELLKVDEVKKIYKGRTTPFIVYWANEPTFMEPEGKSSLKGQFSKQDEVNWTITKGSIVFTKNGEPKTVVSMEVYQALQKAAEARRGKGAPIDHRDMGIVTYDKNGRAMELIQLDISKIGSMQWVKDLMKLMFMETKTSEKAVDFYMESGGTGAQSGKAKWYDLILSIIKSEQLQGEYIDFLKELIENCLWLMNHEDKKVMIEEPQIEIREMIPISREELISQNKDALVAGSQSLETTVRRTNPDASEEWIEEEVARIEEAKQSDDSTSLLLGRQTALNLNDNRNEAGDIVSDEE
ncbi:hypothetical protein [Domibacillus enclensis]|uniref:Phage portal protein, SPP1 family n=1 Tax=Domibacillus enclensis TaxID=1017273 RepID=A0A1N6WIU6_9BACI|nr:hypothetical protein [Domibacillus enclensis]OXS77947.1 hypothetical protein B1B05_10095 [Domibacillus enclensis]SIQ89964.1 hypothetical protein SAMN05443094_104180 [Domibacillus enclensis]